MPKLHDVCQVLSEEILSAVSAFPAELRRQAFSFAWSSTLRAVRAQRDDAAVIIKHLELVMAGLLVDSDHTSALVAPPAAELVPLVSDIFPGLNASCEQLVRQLFP